jgi:DNA polymerase V
VRKLEENGLYTMGDIARCSLGTPGDYHNEDLLYRLFGINAELLIDHAWGWEPCTMKEIKAYRPSANSISSGQVLQYAYEAAQARIVVREMADYLSLDLVDKGLVTDQIVLTVGYDIENLTDAGRRSHYRGEVTTDHYGRKIPKHAHGTANLGRQTSSSRMIVEEAMQLFDRIVDPALLVRRLNITAANVVPEKEAVKKEEFVQLDLFTDVEAFARQKQEEEKQQEKEKKLQQAVLSIKKKYGKNAILKGTSFQEGATARERNGQIGGHKA